MDVYLLVAVATFLCVLLAVPTFLRFAGGGQSSSSSGSGQGQPRAVEANRGPGGRRGPRLRRPVRGDSDDEDDQGDAARREEMEDLEEAGIKVPDGKIGKKKLEKLQAKADKKLMREAQERDREEAKKKREIEEEEEQKAKEKEIEEEKMLAAEEKRKQEEKERKEYEEYLKLKEAFTIDDEGCDENDDSDENKLLIFINHIKEKKVVLLEDLAVHFKIKTQDVIDRISSLQESGDLTGVVDDRGKFIYVSKEELENVAKFMRQQGRVSITDLAANSNKLITLAS